MSAKMLIGISSIAALIVLALVGHTAGWKPIGAIEVIGSAQSLDGEQADQSGRNSDIEAYALITGWVLAPANILIDQSAHDLPDHLNQAQWVPSIAFVVRHPDLGVAIIDTGLRAGECDYGLQPIYWVPCRNEVGDDLVSQLQALGIEGDEVRYVIPSHFHGDHISGLEGLLAFTNAPLLVTEEALETVRGPLRFTSGIPTQMLSSDMDVVVMDTGWRDDLRLGRVFDVFGDGALKLFETPGHARGHVSALLTASNKAFLLTFDAAHIHANMELQIPSGAVASHSAAINSLAALQTIADADENIITIYGHEPTQWTCGLSVINLNDQADECLAQIANADR